ncbi:GNAT family N-acetyltransferase [Rhizobium tibeticum]|uniref:GNAT family N-acetyltransferase n=1 Tax=Rhizobium tibeticum TaxID=501024 RepID=UPI0027D8DEF4|nr:GNAT family N-acetyltransferase [Rhizobium tibeticum]
MGPHIKRRWGWEEQFQRNVHAQKLRAKPFSLIALDGRAIGTVSFERLSDHLQFGEFYILSEFRGQGIGSRVLKHCLLLADEMHLPVLLEHLLWNPVGLSLSHTWLRGSVDHGDPFHPQASNQWLRRNDLTTGLGRQKTALGRIAPPADIVAS